MNLPKLEKWQKIGIVLCGAGFVCSLLLFVPFVQNLILDFGERLVSHPLTRPVWVGRFIAWGITLCIIFFIISIIFYTSPYGYNKIKFINKKEFGKKFVYTNVIFFSYLFFTTEILGLLKILERKHYLFCWIIFFLVGFITNLYKKKKENSNNKQNEAFDLKDDENNVFIFLIILIVVVFLGILAITVVPFNYDSMTYHCSRVMNWIQNKSVSYYPTNITRQLYTPPLAEYTLMFLYLLFDSDVAFNLVQYYSYIVSAIMLYLIFQKIGINKKLSLVGVLLVLSMPIAIAESITNQTDLFASIWLLFFIYIILDFVNYETIEFTQEKSIKLIMLSCIIGLGYLSKTQICLPIAVFLIWMLVVRIKKHDRALILVPFIFIAVFVILLFTLPSFVRNYKALGNIFAANFFSNVSIGTYKPNFVIVNILKNFVHTSITNYNIPLNKAMVFLVKQFSILVNTNIDSELISFGGYTYSPNTTYHCDGATAPFIGFGFMASIIIEIIFIIKNIRNRNQKTISLKSLKITLFISIVSVLAYVRWQPWVTRLLLPIYMLMILFCILVLNECSYLMKKQYIINIFSTVLLLFSFPSIVYQAQYLQQRFETKNKYQMYFSNNGQYKNYQEIVYYAKRKDYHNIGIYLGSDTYEYPLWVALKNDTTKLIQVVFNNSNAIEKPECIIAINTGSYNLNDCITYLNDKYICIFNSGENFEYALFELKN